MFKVYSFVRMCSVFQSEQGIAFGKHKELNPFVEKVIRGIKISCDGFSLCFQMGKKWIKTKQIHCLGEVSHNFHRLPVLRSSKLLHWK